MMSKLRTSDRLIMTFIAVLWMLGSAILPDRDGKVFMILISQLWLIASMVRPTMAKPPRWRELVC